MIVVIPTCRGVNLEYLAPLIDHGCRFIVVDDTEGSVKVNHRSFEVYAWPDRSRLLGDKAIAIPRGNGACRDLGFYIAWKEGEDDEIIVALDDDCVVESHKFVDQVLSSLDARERPVVSGLGRHFNIFDLYDDSAIRSQFPRGFPYAARIGYQPWAVHDVAHSDVLMHLGLWRGVLDINAVDRVSLQRHEFPDAALRCENVGVPPGALISLCAGNMHCRRSVIPALYQLPMNIEIMPGWKVNRFGDIWGGFILKSLMDRRGDCLSVGQPMVRHERVGPHGVNVREEHLAHLVNEEFIALLDRACEEIEPQGYLDMMTHLHEEFARLVPATSPILRIFLGALDRSLGAWIAALGACAR